MNKDGKAANAPKVMVRFEREGHREEIKASAALAKRSLNKQILVLIEAGEKALNSTQVRERQLASKR